MTVTSKTVSVTVLEPSLDARAHNLDQEALIFNPTPERDSLLEHVQALLGHGVAPGVVADIVTLLRKLAESNVAEGEIERHIAGTADEMVRLLHRLECEQVSETLTSKAIARALHPALDVIVDMAGRTAHEIVDAAATIDRLISDVPSVQLLSSTVERNLRPRKFQLLRELHAQRSAT